MSATMTGDDAFERGEPHVGFAWVLRAMIYTLDTSIHDPVCMPHGSTKSDRAASVAPPFELGENNRTRTTIRVKQGDERL